MANTTATEGYDIYECGTFWDLAIVFGFSNAVDGDSFADPTSTPKAQTTEEYEKIFARLSPSPFFARCTSLLLDEDELSFSRNLESNSPGSSPESADDDKEIDIDACNTPFRPALHNDSLKSRKQRYTFLNYSHQTSTPEILLPKAGSKKPKRKCQRLSPVKRKIFFNAPSDRKNTPKQS